MASTQPADTWVSAHIYRAGDLDPLLTDAVVPLSRRLGAAGLVRRWFFLRYWAGGPHLRVRWHTSHGHAATVRAVADAALGGYLAASPSVRTFTAEQYETVAARLAVAEPDADGSWLGPNDAVRFLPYRPDIEWYGEDPRLAAVHRHFAEASALAAGVIGAGVPVTRRGTLALGAVYLAARVAVGEDGEVAGRLAATEHDWSTRLGGGPSTQPSARSASPRPDAVLGPTLTRLRRLAVDPPTTDPDTYWLASLHRLASQLRTGAAPHGRLSDPDVLDVCAHLYCNRLGVPARDECRIRFLLAAAGRVGSDAEE